MSSSQDTQSSKPSAKPFVLSQSLKSSTTTSSSRSSSKPVFGQNAKHLNRFGDEDDIGNDGPPQEEELSGFEAGSAIPVHKREAKKPLVIQVSNKNNWRDRVRGRKGNAPTQQAERPKPEENTETEMPDAQYGLVFADSSKNERDDAPKAEDTETIALPEVKEAEDTSLTQDEAALQALIRESKDDGTRRSNMVISVSASEKPAEPYDETRDFRADVASRPEPASLAAYNAVPVEEFGAALLRGMGWKEGEPVGRNRYGSITASLKPRVPERRPGFLGIGAKEIPGKGGELEIGAWGKKAMRRAKTVEDSLYTPVVMKNKKTGETLTEDEFKRLREEQEREEKEQQRSESRRHDKRHDRRDRDDYAEVEDRHSSGRQDRHKDRYSDRDSDRRRYREHDRSRRHSPTRRREPDDSRYDDKERRVTDSHSSRRSGRTHDYDDEHRYDRRRHDRRRHDDNDRDHKRMRRH
ncbi:pre-mRNA-splicing factor spp2 [Ascosphaera apis ARSEF 7405]|uniref:Pre-mRNA-splicing factor n=1 Tax=Ascosphaera apis ARSEF 7405 TaxID=392613 RepID=A0A162IR46_9EURO|nr:pre-mRNA-splicing factor spp2 [Ascosphaera apis ARSEF 7405]